MNPIGWNFTVKTVWNLNVSTFEGGDTNKYAKVMYGFSCTCSDVKICWHGLTNIVSNSHGHARNGKIQEFEEETL